MLRRNIISIHNPSTCRIELSNLSCLIVVCKRGSDTVRPRGLESSLRHERAMDTFSYTFVSFNVL